MTTLRQPGGMPASQPHTAPTARRVERDVVAGAVLFLALLLQQASGWRWPWLDGLQADDVYKQVSGFLLFAFVLHQWYFPLRRAQGHLAQAARAGVVHRLAGAAAPLLFFVHAQHLGHAYTVALALAFLALFLTGLTNTPGARIAHPGWRTAWTIAHVGLASALPFLVGFHLYVTYAFE